MTTGVKILDLPLANPLNGNESFVVVQGGVTLRTSAASIMGAGRQEVFIGEPAVAPTYPAIILAETVVDGQTVYEFKVNVP